MFIKAGGSYGRSYILTSLKVNLILMSKSILNFLKMSIPDLNSFIVEELSRTPNPIYLQEIFLGRSP